MTSFAFVLQILTEPDLPWSMRHQHFERSGKGSDPIVYYVEAIY